MSELYNSKLKILFNCKIWENSKNEKKFISDLILRCQKKVPAYILNSKALNIDNKILWIHICLILVIIKLVYAKKNEFGNDLVVVCGHLLRKGTAYLNIWRYLAELITLFLLWTSTSFLVSIFDKDFCHASFEHFFHLIWTTDHERKSFLICNDFSLG